MNDNVKVEYSKEKKEIKIHIGKEYYSFIRDYTIVFDGWNLYDSSLIGQMVDLMTNYNVFMVNKFGAQYMKNANKFFKGNEVQLKLNAVDYYFFSRKGSVPLMGRALMIYSKVSERLDAQFNNIKNECNEKTL